MISGRPSATAMAAATYRALHQELDQGRIFFDPFAVRILGEEAAIPGDPNDAHHRRMRIFIAARTRIAEEALAVAVEQGVRQLVVLGAGLDTFAYRNRFGGRLRVFEVDHPATQAWKRERLAAAHIEVPEWLTFAPIDFENQALPDALREAGFDLRLPAFFTWLGVVPYLSAEAVWSTLEFLASIRSGVHVVFDYSNPPESLDPEAQAAHLVRAARVAELGEPWQSFFVTRELHDRLREIGFTEIDDLGPRGIALRFFPSRADQLGEVGGHVIHAQAPARL